MRKLGELLAVKLEERLEAILEALLAETIDRAIDRVVDRVVGVDPEPKAESKAKGKGKGKVTEQPAPEAESKTKGKAGKTKGGKAEATEPASEAESKAKAEAAPLASAEATEQPALEERLLSRIEGAASRLGPKYGPMLMRRVAACARRAVNPRAALGVIAQWVERATPEEVVTTLRGSERTASGDMISGWRLVAAKLGIPIKE